MSAAVTDATVDQIHAQATRLLRAAQEMHALARRYDQARCGAAFRADRDADLSIVVDAVANAAEAAANAAYEAHMTALVLGVP